MNSTQTDNSSTSTSEDDGAPRVSARREAFAERQEARRERLEDRAASLKQQAGESFEASRRAVAHIPFGQPILVGHHSERRHRGDVAKQERAMRRAFDLDDAAKENARRAEAVGSAGISSDDPEAVQKLKDQLAALKANQERMRAANAAIRRGKDEAQRIALLGDLGFAEAEARTLLTPDFCRRIGFAAYQLSNNNANIRRIEQRIEQLQAAAGREDVTIEGRGYTYKEDVADNRACFAFPGKPDDVVRELLRRNAFKWSPSRGLWVRQLTGSARWAAKTIREALDAAE